MPPTHIKIEYRMPAEDMMCTEGRMTTEGTISVWDRMLHMIEFLQNFVGPVFFLLMWNA